MGVLECSNGIFVGQRHAGSRGYGCGTVMDVKCGHHAENYAQRGDGPSSQTRAKPACDASTSARVRRVRRLVLGTEQALFSIPVKP